jgi:cytochrome bd-type quinol oxidase subunit 2
MIRSPERGARRCAHVVRSWYVLAASGLAVFAAHITFGIGGAGADDFFNRWFYDALILLAVTGCALRVAWVRAERAAWVALTIAVAAWAAGEVAFDFA